ncbi:MAG: DNA internalization-related competence protein ComEC/Rec2, partial [Gammaproteobacteria bacterium]
EVLIGDTWRPVSGGLLARLPLYPEYAYGDLLEIEGELETPPQLDDFDYREYLLRQGIGSVVDYPEASLISSGHGNSVKAALIDVRTELAHGLERALPEPEASLAAGILFGDRGTLPRDLKDDMNETGTSHLVAVSGQNVILLASALMAGMTWMLGRRPAAWIAIAGILAYSSLVGFEPSVFRAAVMGCLYVASMAIGRQNAAAITITIAAAAICALDPQVVHDISFQLSFAATAGIILLAPILNKAIESALNARPGTRDVPAGRALIDVACMTIAATAFTLPITLINFDRVSLSAPVANLFVVPAFVAIAFTSAMAAVIALIVPGAAGLAGWLAWPPAAYMLGTVRFFADLPFASVPFGWFGIVGAAIYYTVLLGAIRVVSALHFTATESPPVDPRVAVRSRPLIPALPMAALVGLAAVLVWLAVTQPQPGRLSVAVLDVGQGDAILIETPSGQHVLVDGGPSPDAIKAALGRNLAFYERRIDLIVLTHPQADHVNGLTSVLDQYSIGAVLARPGAADGEPYEAWTESLSRHEITLIAALRGQTVDLGDGAEISVIGPTTLPPNKTSNPNDASIVLRLTMGEFSMLLAGDIEREAEEELLASGTNLYSTVLKIAHHGSRTSSTAPFVARVQPSIDIISVGAENPFGHPAPDVLDRLENDLILRTDEHGDITITTDGRRIWLETQRPISE